MGRCGEMWGGVGRCCIVLGSHLKVGAVSTLPPTRSLSTKQPLHRSPCTATPAGTHCAVGVVAGGH